MKKLFTGILAGTMILSSLSMVAVASPVEEPLQAVIQETLSSAESDFQFIDGTITAYLGSGGNVVIPSTINGQAVTSIGDSAFSHCESITSVVIPDSVTTIGYSSFGDCYSLTSVIVGNSVTFIAGHAFSGCTSLSSLTLPMALTQIAYATFYDCTSLTNVYYTGSEGDKENITISNTYSANDDLHNATWHYHSTGTTTPEVTPEATPGQNYPDWVVEYADFISGTIMPDFSSENYGSVCNRALIAQCLFNMAGDGGTYTSKFYDAGSNDTAIGWCDANNVMNGTGDNWFDAAENVTREQLSLILRQLANVQGKDISYGIASLGNFPDGTSGNGWAMAGLAWAVENKLMHGDTEGNLNPLGYVSRVEVAVMLKAFGNI